MRGQNISVSHSGEGARHAETHCGALGRLLAFCVAGHHSGLPNGMVRPESGRPPTTLRDRIAESEDVGLPDGISLPLLEVPGPLKGLKGDDLFEVHFFVRMLFSALVDADFIATEVVLQEAQMSEFAVATPISLLPSFVVGNRYGRANKRMTPIRRAMSRRLMPDIWDVTSARSRSAALAYSACLVFIRSSRTAIRSASA